MAGIGPSSPELDETASPTTKRQTGSTERKSRTRRAHLWPNLSRGCTKEDPRLGEVAARTPARGDRSLEHHNSFKRAGWMWRGAAPLLI
jgi:hypothetical protein